MLTSLLPSVSVPALRQRYKQLYLVSSGRKWLLGTLAPVPFLLSTAFGVSPAIALLCYLMSFSTITDLLWRRIFNWVLAPVLAWAFALSLCAVPNVLPWDDSLMGFGACFGFMLTLYFLFRGGEGDLKLVAVMGAIMGTHSGIEAAMFGYIFAGLCAVTITVTRLVKRSHHQNAIKALPMAPFFTMGVLATLCF